MSHPSSNMSGAELASRALAGALTDADRAKIETLKGTALNEEQHHE